MRFAQGWASITVAALGCSMISTSAHAQEAPGEAAPIVVASEAPSIRLYPTPVGQAGEAASAISMNLRGLPSVQVTPDTRNHQVVVMASPSVQQQVEQLLQQFIQASRSNQAQSGQFTHLIKQVDWQSMELSLASLTSLAPSVTTTRSGTTSTYRYTVGRLAGSVVTVDRRMGSLSVQTTGGRVEGWRKLVTLLDSQIPTGQNRSLIRLVSAEPEPIQRAIRLIRELPGTAKGKNATDDKSVRQSNGPFRTAAFMQDVPPAAGASQENQNPEANTAEGEAGVEGDAGGAGLFGNTEIEFVPELGTIIIKGSQRDIDRVTELIQQIEEQSEVTKPEVEVVELENADANAVADLLSQLYDDVLSARQGEVSITSLDSSNALLLIGRKEAISSLSDLIKKIDQPLGDNGRLRVYRLQYASAADLETRIRDFFTSRPGSEDEVRPGLGTRVRILADYRTNSLIVSAAPRDLQEVELLIEKLDVAGTDGQSEIRVFTLRNSAATDIADALREAIGSDITAGESAGEATVPATGLSINAGEGTGVLSSGVLEGVVITSDESANAVVVRAPSEAMPLIAELVRQLDTSPGVESFVKVFTIENGDALQLTTALQDLFGDDAATIGTSIGGANLPDATGASESSLVPLRFSAEQRTNSIIVSGSAEDIEVVEAILFRLDGQGFADRITEVVWLRHQGSEEVALALQTYVQSRATSTQQIQQLQQGLGPFDLPDRDLIVVSEPLTNSLLISVSPRLYEDVRRLIDQLDRRQPMVLIKVVLAEVSLGDTFEIGGEIGIQDSLVFDRQIASAALGTPAANPGFNFNGAGQQSFDAANNIIGNTFRSGTVAPRALSTFGLGTTSAADGFGGLVLSAASDSVSALFRTLQSANRLQVLSRPHVMTLDNRPGFVQVGRLVARVTDVINNGISGTQVVTQDIEVGLILRVTPRVGADGLIVMDIDATRSEVDSTSGTPIPVASDGGTGSVTINDIIQTTAQSTIAAYSGQTVIFGGLIQKTRENISRRVPYLSNIPYVGNMFKFDRETEVRSETLIVMTPTLVFSDQDLEYVKQVESSRMSWCLADVVEMHGDEGLSGGYGLWGPAVGQTIYPDMQPTVDDFTTPMAYPGMETIPSSGIEPNSVLAPGVIDGGFMMESPPVMSAPSSSNITPPSSSTPSVVPAVPVVPSSSPNQPSAGSTKARVVGGRVPVSEQQEQKRFMDRSWSDLIDAAKKRTWSPSRGEQE